MEAPVIALPTHPVKSSGGPSRVGYEILKSLIREGCIPYYLNFSTGKVHRFSSLEELESVSLDSYSASGFLRNAMAWLASINPEAVDWARNIRFWILSYYTNLHLHGLESKLLHIHGISPALAFSSFRSKQIMWSEHSKGSAIRELHMLRGEPPEGPFASALRRAYMRLLHESSVITFPSWGAVQLFEEYTGWEIPRQRLKIVYNGVPDPLGLYREILDEKPEEGLVVTVAQHVPEKGLDLAFEAIVKSDRPWRWWIIGEPTPWTERFRELLRQNDRSQVRVELLGRLSHRRALALVKRAHVVLATQRVAVFDLSILEAMALGKLIVATGVGGNVEALGENYPFLGQSVEDIAELLQKVYDDFNMFEKVGWRNRERYLSLFTLEAMVSSYKELYFGGHG